MRTSKILFTLLLSFSFLCGCVNEVVDTGPSYADLVTIYAAEVAGLDRLEAKREKLVADYDAATAPAPASTGLGDLEGLLKAASDISANSDELDPSASPDELLDQLADRGGSAQDIASQLLQGLAEGAESKEAATPKEPTPEEAAAKAEFETKLAELDLEIADQKLRVDKARAARDAATAEDE